MLANIFNYLCVIGLFVIFVMIIYIALHKNQKH